jgi:hypothetical protein
MDLKNIFYNINNPLMMRILNKSEEEKVLEKGINSEKFSKTFEMFVAILLGIAAVVTAWAAWQASLYDGNQAQAYTEGNATLADGNERWNEASQTISQDMSTWNQISALQVDLEYANNYGDTDAAEAAQYKIDMIMYSVSDELAAAIDWANTQEEYATPFEMEGFVDSYYADAQAVMDEGYAKIEEGNQANQLGDKQGLVTVVLAVVLFMLGIVGTFNNMRTKILVTCVSLAGMIFGIVMMLGVPALWF